MSCVTILAGTELILPKIIAVLMLTDLETAILLIS